MSAEIEVLYDAVFAGMVRIEVWGWRCERCSHEWTPKNRTRPPKVCPKCKSPYWDRPRRQSTPPRSPSQPDFDPLEEPKP